MNFFRPRKIGRSFYAFGKAYVHTEAYYTLHVNDQQIACQNGRASLRIKDPY